MVNILTPATKS